MRDRILTLLGRPSLLRGAALALATLTLLGCSDDDDPPADTCQDYASVSPGGSFRDDVMPLMSRSCALATSCHQGPAGSGSDSLGLGNSLMQGDNDATVLEGIHTQLLNDGSMRSTMPMVKANDPAGSWLMAKIEYDAPDLATCAVCDGDCGVFMPQGSSSDSGLTRAERDTIAAWILDGAQNN